MELFGNKKKKKDAPDAGKKGRVWRRVVIVLLILAAVVCAVVAGYSIWEKPPDINKNDPAKVTPTPDSSLQNPDVENPAEDPVDEFDGALLTDRNDGVYTFLLVGRDFASNSTDTIIVGKMDTVNHTLDCVNIPRDTLVNVSWASTPKKLNTIYPGYTNSGKSGIDGLKTHIKNLTGFDVDCYGVVNLEVVENIIDAIGGVYFDVPIDMDYDDGGQHFHVHLKAGYQLLDGYEALGVFRYRYGNDGGTYPGGDLQRIGVQQDLMKSIAAQVLSWGNIPNLGTIIQLCVDNVETDLDASNIAFFARQFLKCSADDVNFHTAPTGNSCLINDVSFVSLDVNAWLEMVNEYLNPYTEPVTTANVNILTSNYDGSSLNATSGTIAGGEESFYCNHVGCQLRFSYHAPGAHVLAVSDPVEDGESGELPPETEDGEPGAGEENSGESGEFPPETEPEPGEEGPEIIDIVLP